MRPAPLALAIALSLLAGCPGKEASKEKDDETEEDTPKKKKKDKKEKKDREQKDAPSATAKATATATAVATASATASAEPPPPAGESFFAGAIPAGVKLKATRGNAIENGALTFALLEGYKGGALPGRDYMATSADSSVVLRVMTSTAVVAELDCSGLASTIGMAPLKGKNVKQATPGKLTKVGTNQFVAKEGSCSAENDKGEIVVHYIDLLKGTGDNAWHYGVLVSFPKDAPEASKDEAKAWARSLEFNGQNGYKL